MGVPEPEEAVAVVTGIVWSSSIIWRNSSKEISPSPSRSMSPACKARGGSRHAARPVATRKQHNEGHLQTNPSYKRRSRRRDETRQHSTAEYTPRGRQRVNNSNKAKNKTKKKQQRRWGTRKQAWRTERRNTGKRAERDTSRVSRPSCGDTLRTARKQKAKLPLPSANGAEQRSKKLLQNKGRVGDRRVPTCVTTNSSKSPWNESFSGCTCHSAIYFNSTILRNSWLEFSWKERKRTDDLPGVVFAAEYSHKVGDGDAPLPPDVEVLERPSDVVFPDKHVPVDSCRKEFLVRPKGTSKMTRERGREGGGQKRSAHAPPNKRRTAISPGPKGNGVGIE